MEYYIVKKGELMHHGILGMKWGVSTLSIFAGTAHQVANRNSGMNKEIRAINEYRERLDAKKKHYLPAKAATVAAGVWAVKKQTRHSNKSKSSNKSKAAYFKNN